MGNGGRAAVLRGMQALEAAKEQLAGRQEVFILSVLEGAMGCCLAYNCGGSSAIALVNGDMCFLAGNAAMDGAEQLLAALKEDFAGRTFILRTLDEGWEGLLGCVFGANLLRILRYELEEPRAGFSREALLAMASQIPEGFTVVPMDGDGYRQAMDNNWSRDLCSQFASRADYLARGLGFVALRRGLLVGGASSYVRCKKGLEIQVDTREDFRRMGLAGACSARLVLACLERGWRPSWDAANEASLGLAQKLGYTLIRPYTAYEAWMGGEADEAKHSPSWTLPKKNVKNSSKSKKLAGNKEGNGE